MILDCRPANCLEEDEDRWVRSLGSIFQLRTLFLKPGFKLITFAEDIRDFYYGFTVPRQRQLRNFFDCPMPGSAFRGFDCFRPELAEQIVCPCLATMAMGDKRAVAAGQAAHLSVALRSGSFDLSEFVSLKAGVPRSGDFSGLMIDDFVHCAQVPLSDGGCPATSSPQRKHAEAKVASLHAAYTAAHLPRHEGKSVRGADSAEVWGAELIGDAGIARPNFKRVIPVAGLLSRLLALGHSTVRLLEVVAGALVSAFQYRRRLMCLLSEIYAAQAGRRPSDIIQFSPELFQELLIAAVVLPFARIDLRAPAAPCLIASDASSQARASVVCPLPECASEEFFRHTLHKGVWSRLLRPLPAYLRARGQLPCDQELPDEHYSSHPIWEEACACFQFGVLVGAKRNRGLRHINTLELQAALEAEARVGEKYPGCRYVHLIDSQVALATLVKGRSSSAGLNRLLRKSVAQHLTSGVAPGFGYIASKSNPADDPTRAVALRAPERCPPPWLSDACLGRFDLLDDLLRSFSLDRFSTSELPHPSELAPDIEVDLRSKATRRADRGRTRRAVAKPLPGPPLTTALDVQLRDYPKTTPSAGSLGLSETPSIPSGPCSARAFPFPVALERPAIVAGSVGLSPALCARASASSLPGFFVPFRADQFVFDRSRFASLLAALDSGPGCIELFAGSRNLSRALVRSGFPWALCLDLAHSPSEDLLSRVVQGSVEDLVSHGCARVLAAGPVCGSFSRAVTPPCRSLEFPAGVPWCSELQQLKCQQGNAFGIWCAKLCRLCDKHDVIYIIENPATSWLWRQSCWEQIRTTWSDFLVDYCRFGTKWRKRTRFRTSCSLGGLQINCQCKVAHLRLRGYNKAEKKSWTACAQAYPRALCNLIAAACASDCGILIGRRKLDIVSCAKCIGSRFGEALRPGPRRPPRARSGRLDDIQLVEPTTAALRLRFWSSFAGWVCEAIGLNEVTELMICPQLFVEALRLYAQVLFSAGTPLHYYRQLVAHVSKEYPSVKPFIGAAWGAVTRWERIEPLQHRPPLPEPVLKAMLALALIHGWYRFAAVTALGFYGVCRVGEPLRASRADLLTPEDLLSDRRCVYLLIRKPKTQHRGASVQHVTVVEPLAIALIEFALEPLPKTAQLFAGSAGSYRRRWDRLLHELGIPKMLKLTPGSLRGGGAVTAHQQGLPIADLQWAMRLRHQVTLAHYLQEVTAVSVLPSLSEEARSNVRAAARFLPVLLSPLTAQRALRA